MRRSSASAWASLAFIALAVPACAGTSASAGSATLDRPSSTAPAIRPVVEVKVPPDNAWSAERQARHVLNRLAFGPSPAELAEVRALGVSAWISRQLQPAGIDDSAVAARIASLETLALSTAELMETYPPLRVQAKRAGVDLAAVRGDPQLRRELLMSIPREDRPSRVAEELIAARLIRAVESRRQLQEVLVDFWFNHFNVSADKGPVRWMITSYERDAIRPNVFGTFRDLLGATAHHPAMLFYLDNWTSTRERPPGRNPKRPSGLNENYARELLELHTLGVDGDYTQDDVREVARAFTGWSIERPRAGATFTFKRRAHDRDAKTILGTTLPAGGGKEDGDRVLDLIVAHPSTARFIATKLCRKFVADEPPAELVERVARVFQRTGGDLPSVYAAIFASPEFWSDAAYGSKTKTPFELAASAIRAVGGTTDGGLPLYRQIARMGEPLYRAQPPTGYPEQATRWINAGALVSRINFGMALAHNRVRGTRVDVSAVIPSGAAPDAAMDALAKALFLGEPSEGTRATILRALNPDPDPDSSPMDGERRRVDPRLVLALLLGSPEFQKQ